MPIVIKSYTEDYVPAVQGFNLRLDAGNAPPEFRLPEHSVPEWTEGPATRRVFKRHFLAVEDGSVRGGYVVKEQDFVFSGLVRRLGYYHLSISEGIVHRSFARVGPQMLLSALREQPLLFALGMGGMEKPLPRMLKAIGWEMCEVPFYFKVYRTNRFFQQVQALRGTFWKRILTDLARFTGTGLVGIAMLQHLAAKRFASGVSFKSEVVRGFASWADSLWEDCKNEYAMVAVRDSQALSELYPANSGRFRYIKVMNQEKVIGWAVLLNTLMHKDKYFGSLRVGSIVDCLASPENADLVIRAASRELQNGGADVVISNQLHAMWCRALRSAGFLRGPSNFVFATSKELSKLIDPVHSWSTKIHINRGDGDGPIHL